jgi:hypothetical protein
MLFVVMCRTGENLWGSLGVVDMVAGIPASEVGFSLCAWPASLRSETERPLAYR